MIGVPPPPAEAVRRSLAVCIATLRRPDQLARLLDRLAACDAPRDVDVEVRVVDNDPEGSGRDAAVEAAARAPALRLRYATESRPGYAHVRNTCLEMGPVDLVAFIDDDEAPGRAWLVRLVETLDESGADAVIGPVYASLPRDAPAWIRRGRFLDAPCGRQGETASWAAGRTGNVLLLGHVFYREGFRFDDSFSQGGEDTDLFSRLDERGVRIVSTDEPVIENVPRERMTLTFLVRRRVRSGMMFARISGRRSDARAPILRVTFRLARWVWFLARSVPWLFVGRMERTAGAILDAAFLIAFIPAILRMGPLRGRWSPGLRLGEGGETRP